MKKPEILAPAGSVESVRAAVAAGCDAVYVGGTMFGARAFADNPDEKNLIEIIQYCHLHGVRVYLTVNTLLKEREMEKNLVPYLRPYYEEGVDAVIVQDFGVLRKIRQHFPDLVIHASTQMTVTGAFGAEYLKHHGVTRVVPARELSLPELQSMRENTSLEMEVFVHGALCYCYSGRCLLSSVNGGRSGNRGRCAQPCRLAYTNGRTGKESYLLSPKELCSLEILPELIEAGMDSFKIEGRMKRAEYTGFTTYIYRKYRDLYFAHGKEGYKAYLKEHSQEYQQDLENLMQMYNRNGFTHGYASGDVKNMLSDARPNHNGIYIGRVVSTEGITATVKLEKDIYPQDSMVFRKESGKEIYDYTVGEEKRAGDQIRVHFRKGAGVKRGDTLYRMKKGPLLQWIQEEFLHRKPQVEVSGTGKFLEGEKAYLLLRASLPWGECVVERAGDVCQSARQHRMEKKDIRRILEKTGNETFCFASLDLEISGNVFVPVGALKNLRRSAMEELEKKILMQCKRNYNRVEHWGKIQKKSTGLPEVMVSVDREEQLAPVLESPWVSTIFLSVSYMHLEEALKTAKRKGKKVYLRLPRVLRRDGERQLLETMTELVGKAEGCPDGVVIRNVEEMYIVKCLKEKGISFSVMTDFDMYVLNSGAAQWLWEQGADVVTLSPELNQKEIGGLCGYLDGKLCYTIYGYQELMISAQCVNREYCMGKGRYGKDNSATEIYGREGARYLVKTDCRHCQSTLYSGAPVWLFSQWEQWIQAGISVLRLDFVFEDEKETKEVLGVLQDCMDGVVPADDGEYTGHVYKGVH